MQPKTWPQQGDKMKTLNHLKTGESGVVDYITADGALKRHFLDMGITKGVVVTMERIAPCLLYTSRCV